MAVERLQKLISKAGIASRREAEELIKQGRVTINGKRAVLGDRADLSVDEVRVDGERLKINTPRIYIMLNKPMGVVTAVTPQHQETRQTVRDLIPLEGHLYPAGRLDADSEGLVLMTNDGDLAERLTHPRYQKAKVYEVTVLGRISDEALEIWSRGVMLDDGKTLPVQIKVLRREAHSSTLQITMTEGRKRQIRRVANTLGYPVQRLVRTHFATLALGDLKPGQWRHLTETEVATLKAFAYSLSMTPKRFVQRPARRLGALRRSAPAQPAQKREDRPTRPAKPSSKPRPERITQRPTKPRRKPNTAKRPPRRRK
ncbi:MAG: hypothetical protein CUN49_03285 [Candidatus Thermofonsia Clade 1 bacterium]|uniref:Pseudouridine synthase n=1 Tax=Candidatus Thermofonsia Clade 1 bacterium TaxID=2364210 RepID=A0A2M8PH40_9CHLR|nr:MAG: hypothetical protein CUN49_03285 [Candidatus Thermofonsia Clade 1 bacterium]RMF53676.1 MAG: pseudouridine synthase [Chloroflexota bacterium]